MAWLRNLQQVSIKTKLIVLIVVFLCLPFLTLGILWYEISTESIEKNAIEYNRQMVSQVNDRLEAYFADLETTTYPYVVQPLIQDFIDLDNPIDLAGRLDLLDSLPNLFFGRDDVFGFSIVSASDMIVKAVNGRASYGTAEYAEHRNIYLAESAMDGPRYKILGIDEVSSNVGSQEKVKVLRVVRKFTNPETYRSTGLLIMDLQLDRIAGIAETLSVGPQSYVWVIDSNGLVVYHPDKTKLGQPVEASYMNDFERYAKEGVYFKTTDGQRELVVFRRSDRTGWTMVSEVPMRALIGDLIHLRNYTLWAGSALVFFVLVVLAMFSISLTRSLRHLQHLMQKAENGDLMVKAPSKRRDEIGGLNRSFNKMVAEIRRLIEVVHASRLREKEMEIKQREAMMRALQSQINPHFLYNTLEVINSYAILEGVMPISKMATSLADVFRYSIGNPNERVSLRDELTHMKSYFDILSERYPYLEVDDRTVPEDVAGVDAVRLVVQPIVENSFKHGYEKYKLRLGYIGFAGERSPDYFILRIVDRGVGMTSEQAEAYNRYFQQAEPIVEADGRIGLWNVHQRIRLAYGAPYGLYIESSGPEGTVIQVRLPYSNL
ncbi:cache domain-containing sensor histidine kinase [Paenibacillus sp.]|uniref:cache domain-containing sensor histidine kinase n=1 Tax=Paenibacillus sp. TaxID=58172 RepID=UPI002D650DD4|nr:histidine kinase [Paenibacillus sp.]HZG57039.1 histidine kinase [Paenibacillus sp.]